MSDDQDDRSPAILEYGVTSSAPSIVLPDTKLFKSERGSLAQNYFEEKLRELEQQYASIKQLAENTELVYNAKYSFIPRVGKTYYLYESETIFLSMISPDEWDNKYNFLGSFTYTADATWEKNG